MTDGTQALAERLHETLCDPNEPDPHYIDHDLGGISWPEGVRKWTPCHPDEAAAILADGSVYLTAAEAARYRAIEEAADHIVALRAAPLTDGWWVSDEDFAALRAALDVSR